MKFACDQCHTKYSLDDARVAGKVLKIRCKTCQHIITVRDPALSADAPAPTHHEEHHAETDFAPNESTVVSAAPGAVIAAMGAKPPAVPPHIEWYVSFDGVQEGPHSLARVHDRIRAEANIGKEIFCWREGFADWLPAEKVSDMLPALKALAAAKPPAPSPSPRAGAVKTPAAVSSVGAARPTAVKTPATVGAVKPEAAKTPAVPAAKQDSLKTPVAVSALKQDSLKTPAVVSAVKPEALKTPAAVAAVKPATTEAAASGTAAAGGASARVAPMKTPAAVTAAPSGLKPPPPLKPLASRTPAAVSAVAPAVKPAAEPPAPSTKTPAVVSATPPPVKTPAAVSAVKPSGPMKTPAAVTPVRAGETKTPAAVSATRPSAPIRPPTPPAVKAADKVDAKPAAPPPPPPPVEVKPAPAPAAEAKPTEKPPEKPEPKAAAEKPPETKPADVKAPDVKQPEARPVEAPAAAVVVEAAKPVAKAPEAPAPSTAEAKPAAAAAATTTDDLFPDDDLPKPRKRHTTGSMKVAHAAPAKAHGGGNGLVYALAGSIAVIVLLGGALAWTLTHRNDPTPEKPVPTEIQTTIAPPRIDDRPVGIADTPAVVQPDAGAAANTAPTKKGPRKTGPATPTKLSSEQKALQALYGAEPERSDPTRIPSVGKTEAKHEQVSDAAIMATVTRNKKSVQLCYERVLKHDQSLRSLRVDVEVKIGISGGVTGVSFADRSLNESELGRCLSTTIRRWHFPSQDSEYQTAFPLLLQAQ